MKFCTKFCGSRTICPSDFGNVLLFPLGHIYGFNPHIMLGEKYIHYVMVTSQLKLVEIYSSLSEDSERINITSFDMYTLFDNYLINISLK